MKFIKEETELEQELKDKFNETEDIIDVVSDIMNENDFSIENKLNGIAFNRTLKRDDYDIDCQFYIDTLKNTYSTYVTSNSEDNTVNYTQKGQLKDAQKAAINFINYIDTL